jgi:hypothetical protein
LVKEEKKMSVRSVVLVLAASAAALVGSTAKANPPQASQDEERARERAVQAQERAQQPGEQTAATQWAQDRKGCEPVKLTTEQKADREDWERLQQLRQRVP